jgi:hypothetical protein
MINNYTKERLALFLGGSTVEYPQYTLIGTGSATVTSSSTELTTPQDRQAHTSRTYPSARKVQYITDWTSLELSGLNISEFGQIGSATGTTGSLLSKVVFPAITFDGTNELRIQEVWEVF